MFKLILHSVLENSDNRITKEGIWWICNSINNSNGSSIVEIINEGIIKNIIVILKNWDENPVILELLLKTIENLLRVNCMYYQNDENNQLSQFKENEGVKLLEEISKMQNSKVSLLAQKIIDDYF